MVCFAPKSRQFAGLEHEKGAIEGAFVNIRGPFVNNRGYHVRPVFTLAGGEGR